MNIAAAAATSDTLLAVVAAAAAAAGGAAVASKRSLEIISRFYRRKNDVRVRGLTVNIV